MTDKTTISGLTTEQARQSRLEHGANVLTQVEKASLWRRLLEKFKDPLIIILMIAGVLSIAISIYEYTIDDDGSMEMFFEPVGIFAAVLCATGLSFYFEVRADREFTKLNKLSDDDPVNVIRDANTTTIPKRDVVVGDYVLINTGDEIPADGILIESTGLSVDESSLTGEPMCSKTTNPEEFNSEATYASNIVLRGTKVMEGHAVMRVTAVGDCTENGKVHAATRIDNTIKTPLTEQLDRLGKLIAKYSYYIGALVILGRMAMFFTSGQPTDVLNIVSYSLESIMIAVALLVVSVPEGLPMAVTLSLAFSMSRMLKTNNLVRKMHACETMGATTVICTDKTGTLTQNKMQVYKADFDDHIPTDIIYSSIATNSTAQLDKSDSKSIAVIGNPTEGALLLWLDGQGVDYAQLRQSSEIIEELPFSTERKYMATVIKDNNGRRMLFVKGAPEIIYHLCNASDEIDNELAQRLGEYQNKAMRTLGFAYKQLNDDECAIANGRLSATGLSFMGIVAISDPVRIDVPEAVHAVIDAGVKIKIVTGDTIGTAREIARQIGLWDDTTDGDANIITGTEFEALSDAELLQRIDDIKIIARARPLDKKRLVETLQSKGEVVAVTGDGTNDAPALKAAHVGLSMGDGTSVAKEASDITIIDNSFTSIGRAVMWGRSLYRNIQRFVMFQLTVNVAACLVVLIGSFLGVESPLTVTQMLWVNLAMDTFAAMALASLPPTESVMKDKPRSRAAFIITRDMWRVIIGTGFGIFVIMSILYHYFTYYDVTSLTTLFSAKLSTMPKVTVYELSIFFSIFVFLQFWNLFNARAYATGQSAFHLGHCKLFLSIASIIIVGQIVIVSFAGPFFQVCPLNITDWTIIIISTSLILLIGEAVRFIKNSHSISTAHNPNNQPLSV